MKHKFYWGMETGGKTCTKGEEMSSQQQKKQVQKS